MQCVGRSIRDHTMAGLMKDEEIVVNPLVHRGALVLKDGAVGDDDSSAIVGQGGASQSVNPKRELVIS